MDQKTLKIAAAGLACGIDISDIEEAYQGEYSSDEEFARQTACELGYFNDDPIWPYRCIDWECAARELMFDYATHDNLYFRNF